MRFCFFESTDCTGTQLRGSSHLILLSTSLLIILEDVVPDVVLGVDEELFGVPLLLPALHPHHEQQDHGCNRGESWVSWGLLQHKARLRVS